MKAIILAAGKGVRLRPLTEKTPKPLLKVGGEPLLHNLLYKLPTNVKEIILVVGYLGDQIISTYGESFLGKPIKYIWQKDQLGTYHALKLCEPLLEEGERFGVFFPDDLLDEKAIKSIFEHDLAVIAKEVPDPRRFGVVELNLDGSIKAVEEKPNEPKTNLALTTGYVLNKNVLKYDPSQSSSGEYYLSWSIGEMAKNHKINVIKADFWFPIATPEDIARAEELIRQEQRNKK